MGQPIDACEIEVRKKAEVYLYRWCFGGRVAAHRFHEESYDGDLCAGGGVALFDYFQAVGVDVEPVDLGDGRVSDSRVGDAFVVRRPPVSCGAVHFLLSDEFGRAVADGPAAIFRDSSLRRGEEVVDDEGLIADEAHI